MAHCTSISRYMIHTVEHHYHGFYSQQCTHIASSAAEAESAAVATGFTAA